jgi:hypothetical protein
MNATNSLRWSVRAISRLTCLAACAITVQAAAQVTPDQPKLIIPAESQTPATDIRVTKAATGRGFEITVGNYGMNTVPGLVVTDRIGNGQTCPADNPVTVIGGAAAERQFTIADLTGPGILLGTLLGDQIITLKFDCKGN